MGNLDQQLKKFEKTDKFRKNVEEKLKHNFSSSNSFGLKTLQTVKQYGSRMKEILREDILDIKSSTTGESFLDHIIVSEEFRPGLGWIINIFFDEDEVTRNSLYWQSPKYEMGAYLPVLFNEGYDAKSWVYGYDNNGNYIRSLTHRDALHFIQKSVDRFNTEQKGMVVAEYSDKYSGGTFW